jgi:1A family penicillin-binding protein
MRIPTLLPQLVRRAIKMRKWFGLVVFVLVALILYIYIFRGLPSPYKMKDYRAVPLSTHIYDRNGKPLYEIYHEENRTPVKLKDLPPHISQATIAIEDKDFFQHKGISIFGGIFRAIKDMVVERKLQGGSTLTQQLVKSALLTPERTIQRKIKEIILALWTEQIYTKQEILELYLNQVPYGGSAYGIEEASKAYYGKSAKKLTLAEAALLAGLPQAPSYYSPHSNPDAAKARRDTVLDRMREQKYITKEQEEKASATAVSVTPPKTTIKAPHFVFYVKQELERLYGIQQVEEGGLRVTTTLDLDIQEESEKILREELEDLEDLDVSNGAVLVTRPPTGEILAMIGSVDYFASPSGAFNVTTALRQPGSSIKPLNYALGIDLKTVTAASVFLDVRTCFKGGPKEYCPVNYDGTFHGPVQLRHALGNSFNIPAVKMLAMNGLETFIATASALTITSFKDPSNYGLSLTLGGGEVKMLELAQAFSSFPNRGKPKKSVSILKVQDKFGKELYKYEDLNFVKDVRKPLKYPNFFAISGKRVFSPETAFIMSHILLDNAARTQAFGPSSELVIPQKNVSVKTGTTDDKKDNWTIGYTPNFMTTVWVGNNDNTPMHPFLTSGVTGAAPIWNRIMRYLLEDQPDLQPIRPETVVGRQVCTDTGKVAGQQSGENKEGCPTRFEYFIRGTEATSSATIKREQVPVSKDTDRMTIPTDPSVEMREKTVIKDPFSTYCIDCAHEEPTPTPAR